MTIWGREGPIRLKTHICHSSRCSKKMKVWLSTLIERRERVLWKMGKTGVISVLDWRRLKSPWRIIMSLRLADLSPSRVWVSSKCWTNRSSRSVRLSQSISLFWTRQSMACLMTQKRSPSWKSWGTRLTSHRLPLQVTKSLNLLTIVVRLEKGVPTESS